MRTDTHGHKRKNKYTNKHTHKHMHERLRFGFGKMHLCIYRTDKCINEHPHTPLHARCNSICIYAYRLHNYDDYSRSCLREFNANMSNSPAIGYIFDLRDNITDCVLVSEEDDDHLQEITREKEVHTLIRKEGEETSTQGVVTLHRNANEDGKERSVEAARKAEWRSRSGNADLEKKAREQRKQILLSRETEDMKAARLAKQRDAKRRQRLKKKLLCVTQSDNASNSPAVREGFVYNKRKTLVNVVKTTYFTHCEERIDPSGGKGTLVQFRLQEDTRVASVVEAVDAPP